MENSIENEMTDKNSTEKITINLNVVELGYIDLLVSEGYYSNRTDFIKSAIRKQIDYYSDDTKKVLGRRESKGYELSIGIGGFTKKDLIKMKEKGEKKSVVFVGLFFLPQDVPLDLLEDTIDSLKVYGVSKCSLEVKEKYHLKG